MGHVHPSYDGSLHVVLDIESARQVVATGRGEFHPAAARGLPPGTVMVYAPLDRLDVEDCLSILEAAHAYASSVAGHVVHRPALTWPAAPEPAPAVCVVGSGEVACALALRLAQSGIDTRLARGTEWPVARRLPVGMDRPLLEALDGAGTVVICVSIDTALKLAHRYPAFAGDRVVIDVTLPSADGSASPRSRSIALARAIPYARLVGGLDEIRTASGGSSAVDLLAQTRVYSDDSSAKGLLTALLKRSGVIAVDDGLLAGCDEPEPER
ncbi:MAG TPA: NAD(P)-binding domain-containing protein [Kineosporiaceae bacterium]